MKSHSPHRTASRVRILLAGWACRACTATARPANSAPSLPHNFEKTTALVSSGVLSDIRYPIHASLIAQARSAHFQEPSPLGGAIALFASFFPRLTAKAEERECPLHFGTPDAEYKQRTRMFIPFLP